MFRTIQDAINAEESILRLHELEEDTYQQHLVKSHIKIDKLFIILFIFQWLLGITMALLISPKAWNGGLSTIHIHVWAAIILGFIIISFPLYLIYFNPGKAVTRHCIAISQMLTSALLIHLSGGRIETHFHVFGSLAFLSCYRDCRVLITATIVTALDHYIRGVYWPESIYGIITGSHWLWLEHCIWVVFTDIFLIYSGIQGNQEWKEICNQKAALYLTNIMSEKQIAARTEELKNALDTTQKIYSGLSQHALMAITDIKGEITQVNSKFCELSKYPKQELLGQNLRILKSEEHDTTFFSALWKQLETGQVWQGELKNKAKDGSFYWVQATIFSLLSPDGKPEEYVTLQHDITELKEKRIDSLRLAEEAQAANNAKSEFLANMSHEIRTPLNAILGMSQLLFDTHLNSKQQDYCQIINKSGEVLLSILNDILDFSKIEAGKLDIENIPFNLAVSLEELIDLVAHQVENKSLEFILQIEPDVPLNVIGDPGRIRQILLNLLTNAFKFTEHGHVIVRVRCLEKSEQLASIHFSVEDTGKGIHPDKLSSLFNKFTQEDASTTRQYGGSGLGLAICKSLAQIMQGSIGVESNVGNGSIFWFTLPLPLTNEVMAEPLFVDVNETIRILIISMQEINRQVLSQSLTDWNMTCETVTNGSDALNTLLEADEPFHMVIMDGMTTEVNGRELIQYKQEYLQLQKTRFILLAARGQRDDAKHFQAKGFDAYLTKPVHQSILFHTIMRVYQNWLSNTHPSHILTRFSVKEQENINSNADQIHEMATLLNDSICVLLVEDNVVNRKVANLMLSKLGITVDIAGNGIEALEMLSLKDYHAILMDCQMPEMDGYQATRLIRERTDEKRNIPIIAMTANALTGDATKCYEVGMDDYLAKPVKNDELKAILLKWTCKKSA